MNRTLKDAIHRAWEAAHKRDEPDGRVADLSFASISEIKGEACDAPEIPPRNKELLARTPLQHLSSGED